VFIYVLRIQDITVIITPKSIRRFVFVMEIQYLQCAEEIEIFSYSAYFRQKKNCTVEINLLSTCFHSLRFYQLKECYNN